MTFEKINEKKIQLSFRPVLRVRVGRAEVVYLVTTVWEHHHCNKNE